ncbi:hypothetical protein ACHAXS_009728 [Conticribra weissflogii]
MIVFQRYLLIQYLRSMRGQQDGEGSEHDRLDEAEETGEPFSVRGEIQEIHLRRRDHRPQKRPHEDAVVELPHDDRPADAEREEHDGRPRRDEGSSAAPGGHGPHGDEDLDDGRGEDEPAISLRLDPSQRATDSLATREEYMPMVDGRRMTDFPMTIFGWFCGKPMTTTKVKETTMAG